MGYFAICEQCEPGVLPVEHGSAAERDEWLERHARETAHQPRAYDYPRNDWD